MSLFPRLDFKEDFQASYACWKDINLDLLVWCGRKKFPQHILPNGGRVHWWLAMVQSVKKNHLKQAKGELSLAVILHHLSSTSELPGWYEPAREVAREVANQPWKILQSTGKSSSETIEHLWKSTPKYIISQGEWYAWIMKISLETTHWFLLKPSFLI